MVVRAPPDVAPTLCCSRPCGLQGGDGEAAAVMERVTDRLISHEEWVLRNRGGAIDAPEWRLTTEEPLSRKLHEAPRGFASVPQALARSAKAR